MTVVRRSRVRELVSIRFVNVTSANVIRFFLATIYTQYKYMEQLVANLVTTSFQFTSFIKHDTSWSSDFTCISGTGIISHRPTALRSKYTVHNFGMDISKLLNCSLEKHPPSLNPSS